MEQQDPDLSRPEVLIGRPNGDHISIRVVGRMHPHADDYWDGNWLVTPIDIVAGGFHGSVAGALRADELKAFRDELFRLHETLQGSATLESMEQWLSLVVVVSSGGGVDVTGNLVDAIGIGNRLTFRLGELDQSDLPSIIDALEDVQMLFPVIGTP